MQTTTVTTARAMPELFLGLGRDTKGLHEGLVVGPGVAVHNGYLFRQILGRPVSHRVVIMRRYVKKT